MAILSILLTVIIITISILMVLIVLIQRPKQEGLGAAFGGGALDSALGAHTTDILQKFTTWLGVIFFVSAIGLSMVKTRQFREAPGREILKEVEGKGIDGLGPIPEMMNLPGLEGAMEELGLDTPVEASEDKPAADDTAKKEAAPAAPKADKPAADDTAKKEAAPAAPKADKPAADDAAKKEAAPAAPKADKPAPAAAEGKAKE